MESWIIFTLIAELIWAFTSFIDKILLSKNYIKSPFVFVVFNGAMSILLIFLLPFASFEPLSVLNLLLVLIAGLVYSFGIVLYYKAVQHEEISRVLILWQIIPIFVLIISFFFLNEALAKQHFIGFLLLLVAGTLISYKKINDSLKISKAFYLMLGSAFLIALFYVLSKHIYSITGFWSAFMWIRLASFSGVLFLIIPSIRKQFTATFRGMQGSIKSLLGFKMLIDFLALIFLGYAMINGPVSLISALGSATAPIFIFLIALFSSIYIPHIIKEDIDKKSILIKIMAIALIIIGIVFVNL